MGLSLISKMRSDLGSKFRDHFDPQIFMSYVYHCNVQTASGEDAFTVDPFSNLVIAKSLIY